MKLSFAVPLLVLAGIAVFAQTAMPRMTAVDPLNAKAGDVIVVTGENLAKDAVTKVYITDGTNDTPVDITEQSATTIKFKLPTVKAGRVALMVLTAGKEPKLIEQPVKLTIDE